MTSKENIIAALSKEGTAEIPLGICYEKIFYRDHWNELTSCPWWYQHLPEIEPHYQYIEEIMNNIVQDWYRVPHFYSTKDRTTLAVEVRQEGVFRINKNTGNAEKIPEPIIGGIGKREEKEEDDEDLNEVANFEYIDANTPEAIIFDLDSEDLKGKNDLAVTIAKNCGMNKATITHIESPLWKLYYIWGFTNMMILLATRPDLVKYACERFLAYSEYEIDMAAYMSADIVFIEECLTDMISPEMFREYNMPMVSHIVEKVRRKNMKSIYYFCGDTKGKFEDIVSIGADALSFEESKKGFVVDIEYIADQLKGRCSLVGNLDAIGILQNGSDQDMKNEIKRQINAGRRNKSRFIMGIGSPITPSTSVERVKLFCELSHEYGKL